MKSEWTASGMLTLAAAVLVVAGAAVAVSNTQEVPEPRLGPGWQCSRTMVLLMTTCSHSRVRPPTSQNHDCKSRPSTVAEKLGHELGGLQPNID